MSKKEKEKEKLQWELWGAAIRGDIQEVTRLIQQGVDVNCRWFAATPLQEAASGGQVGVAELLLEAGARVDSTDWDGETPLHNAASGGHVGVAELLLKYGARVDSTGLDGATPLHKAASGGHVGVVEHLLKYGARVECRGAYNNGATPLHSAASGGHVGVADLLLKAGAPVGSRDGNGATPLHEAASGGHVGVAELLLKAGARVNSKDWFGSTPKDMAAREDVPLLMKGSKDRILEGRKRIFELFAGVKMASSVLTSGVHPVKMAGCIGRKVGPEGGELKTTPCTVTVPPGAVTMETEITCQAINPNDVTLPLNDGEMLVSDVIELGPHGTSFHQPVTVQMQYCSPSSDGDREAIVLVTEDGSQWAKLETRNKGENRVEVSVDHFSIFAVVSQPKHDKFTLSTEECTLTSSTQHATLIERCKLGPEGGELQTRSCTVTVPPGAVTMETGITCKVINPNDVTLPLKEGEMLVSDVIELGPHGTTFHQPVTVQMQYSSAPSGGDKEAVMLVTEDGADWTELTAIDRSEDKLTVSVDHFSIFAVISQPKQDEFTVSTEGRTLPSSTQPDVQISFPEGAVTTLTHVTLQVQEVPKQAVDDIKAKNQSFNHLISTSPILKVKTVSDSEVQFHKPVTVRVPHPQHYMDIQHEGPTELRIMSCEEGAEDWVDMTDNVTDIFFTDEFVEFQVVHFTRWIAILVASIGEDPQELGSIPLHLCRWLEQRAVQFILLQREGNANEFVIECVSAEASEKIHASLVRTGYKGPVPSNSVKLFEGQKVKMRLVGNVSIASFDAENTTITFHSQTPHQKHHCNRLQVQIIALEDREQNGLDGKGSAEFFALPRVEVSQEEVRKITRRKALVRKEQTEHQHSPGVEYRPTFLCKVPVHVPYETQKMTSDGAEGGPTLKGVGKYFFFLKEHVSTDWKDLAHHLGFNGPDIGNIDGRNNDDKSCCYDMLCEWQKRKGHAATIEVLLKALAEAGLQSVVDGLGKHLSEIVL